MTQLFKLALFLARVGCQVCERTPAQQLFKMTPICGFPCIKIVFVEIVLTRRLKTTRSNSVKELNSAVK